MGDIGVVHGPIGDGGGAEAVAAHTLAALAEAGHDLTLYTTDDVETATLERRYSAPIRGQIERVVVRTPATRTVDTAAKAATVLGVTDFPLLRQSVLERVVLGQYRSEHDVLVCTHGEFAVDGCIEYIHFPYFSASAMQRYGNRFEERLYPPYHRLCRMMKYRERDAERTTITNSKWTADVLSETLDLDATVVYPPVDTAAFEPPPWEQMEDGFVAIGRIHPLKRQHRLVDIIEGLRERGVKTHIHIAGPVGDQQYFDRLVDQAENRSFVHVEGELDRDALVSLLESHRFGIHGREFEHFGIVVAEMVASGAIPFVPASGGQREIVDDIGALCYSSRGDAIETIADLWRDTEKQRTIRDQLGGTVTRYSVNRFQQSIQELVARALTQR